MAVRRAVSLLFNNVSQPLRRVCGTQKVFNKYLWTQLINPINIIIRLFLFYRIIYIIYAIVFIS